MKPLHLPQLESHEGQRIARLLRLQTALPFTTAFAFGEQSRRSTDSAALLLAQSSPDWEDLFTQHLVAVDPHGESHVTFAYTVSSFGINAIHGAGSEAIVALTRAHCLVGQAHDLGSTPLSTWEYRTATFLGLFGGLVQTTPYLEIQLITWQNDRARSVLGLPPYAYLSDAYVLLRLKAGSVEEDISVAFFAMIHPRQARRIRRAIRTILSRTKEPCLGVLVWAETPEAESALRAAIVGTDPALLPYLSTTNGDLLPLQPDPALYRFPGAAVLRVGQDIWLEGVALPHERTTWAGFMPPPVLAGTTHPSCSGHEGIVESVSISSSTVDYEVAGVRDPQPVTSTLPLTPTGS